MKTNKQRLFTGVQSSGTLHIGNYFGAMKPFLDLYDSYESFLMIADYHALTSLRDNEALRKNSYNVVKDFLAVGLDVDKVTFFRQSDNQDHTELSWVLNCMVTVPFLMQAHSYKDKVAKGLEANAGLFTYPMLQAADITLYDADVVPVGEDQRQHIEYTREAVKKLNLAYGDVLKEPQEKILDSVGIVPGLDGQKMSKSYGNTIPLFGSKEEIETAVAKIVTDSSGDHPENVYAIHKLLREEAELESLYLERKGKYGELKKALANDLEEFIAPMRERREKITDDMVREILHEGATKARSISNQTLERVRQAVGISL